MLFGVFNASLIMLIFSWKTRGKRSMFAEETTKSPVISIWDIREQLWNLTHTLASEDRHVPALMWQTAQQYQANFWNVKGDALETIYTNE